MGLFKDVRKMSALGKEASKNFDPAAQMRDARAQMQQLTQQQELVGSATSVQSPATVVQVRDTGTMVNMQQLFDCDVTVQPAGGVPFPATVSVMGAARLTTLQPGNQVVVVHEPGDTSRVSLL